MFSDKQKKQTDEGEEYRQAEKKIHTSSEDDNLRSTTIQGLGGLVGTLLQLAVMRSLLDEIKDGLRQGLAGDGPGCEAMLATKNVLVHLDIPQHTGIGLFGHFCQEEFLASKKKKKVEKKSKVAGLEDEGFTASRLAGLALVLIRKGKGGGRGC